MVSVDRCQPTLTFDFAIILPKFPCPCQQICKVAVHTGHPEILFPMEGATYIVDPVCISVKTPGTSLLDDFEPKLVEVVEEFVGHLARGRLV